MIENYKFRFARNIDWASVIGAGASLLGNLFSTSSSNSAQSEENQKNRDWQEYMWNLNNEYNLPTNQVQRLIDANLNPALMYGSSSSNASGSSTSMAGTPSTSNQFRQTFSPETVSSIAQLIQAGVSSKVGESQIDLNKLDAYQKSMYNNSLVERYQLEVEGLRNNNALVDALTAQSLQETTLVEYQKNKLQAEIEVLWGQEEMQGIDLGIKQSIMEYQNKVNFWYDKLQASTIALNSQTGAKYKAEADLSKALEGLNKQLQDLKNVEWQIQSVYGMDSAYYDNFEKYATAIRDIIESTKLSFNIGPAGITFHNDFNDYSSKSPQKRHSNTGIMNSSYYRNKK